MTRPPQSLLVLFLLTTGCVDYLLWWKHAPGETGAWDSRLDSGSSVDDTSADSTVTHDSDAPIDETAEDCDDTGLHPGEPEWEVGPPEADGSGLGPTCTEVGEISWDLVEEWRFELERSVMNPVVAPQADALFSTVFLDRVGESIVGLDGRDGSVEFDYAIPLGEGNDGGTPAVGNADGSPGLELATQSFHQTTVFDVSTGADTTFSFHKGEVYDEAVSFADLDNDGFHDVFSALSAYTLDGVHLAAFLDIGREAPGFFTADLDGDSLPELVNGYGVWDPLDMSVNVWPELEGTHTTFKGLPVDVDGEVAVWYETWGSMAYLLRLDGTELASFPMDEYHGQIPSLGDTTGDGIPELCFQAMGKIWLVGLDGYPLHSWGQVIGQISSGGCSMADLDADGVYELIAQDLNGFYIFDGRSGDTLASTEDLPNSWRDSSPVIADIDGDGSAEILVLSDDALVVLGPATGRWARTRPVWHQLAYDITSIDDQGNLVRWPLPSWSSYNAFRAQPAHDGLRPDLMVDFERDEHSWCEEDFVTLTVTVHNLGSAEAAAGQTMEVHSVLTSGWELVASTTLDYPIPAGQALRAELVLPTEQIGRDVVVGVHGDADECDLINNRSFGS